MSAHIALPPEHDPLPPTPDSGASEPKKKKHKSGTLRRALSWLRGRKKKKPEAKQHQQPESKENSKPDGSTQSISTQEDESLDRMFFPNERNAHLEEIHSQAQEGLKSLQRREKQNKLPSDEENNSTVPSNDVTEESFRTRSLSCSTENTDDAMSVRSEMIQRKGSTFRPHDSPSSKPGKRRREKRATVVGVPQHIAAELGLHTPPSHRGIRELFGKAESQQSDMAPAVLKANGIHREEEYVVIPTVDGMSGEASHDGAHISLAALEQAALKRHIDKVYQDDSCISWKTTHKISPLIRPKSVAVPGMTTHSLQSDPVSPVMSISPQGTYMSKIIPNAVLPPLVDVVALSQSSVRTLSRCSLASASPGSIRGSLHRGRGMSGSSETWSRSQSTETIVSDSSTISSQGGENNLEVGEKLESGLSTGRASPAPSTGTQDGSDVASLCSGRSSVRSVSLRKSKKAPPPPKRTYSLQQQREMGLPPRPEKKPSAKNSSARDPWILRTEKGTESDVFLPSIADPKLSSPTRSDRTLSPSSGYSSQSGTPTLPVRSLHESPGSRRRTPPKPERASLKSGSSITGSSSPPAESNSIVLAIPHKAGSSLGDQEMQDIIPPHPNVPAPTCPPPIDTTDFVKTPVRTPQPSPPPSHHPTPPPVRKSESDAEVIVPTLEETTQKESLWPPPPPEVPDVQDLSMADFPPPEEELFLPPPPSLETVSASVIDLNSVTDSNKDKNEVTEENVTMLISKDDKPLDIVEPQTSSVPLTNKEPLVAVVNSEIPATSVPISDKNIKEPGVPPLMDAVGLPSCPNNSGETLIPVIAYKPHFTTLSEATESKKTLEDTVPQDTTDNQSVSQMVPKVTSDSSAATSVPSPVASTAAAPAVLSPVVNTSSILPPAAGSTYIVSNAWKPVSAPVSRKLSNNQGVVAQPKEDASLPIVTPSLLQMVRLRSVQARGPQTPFSQFPPGIVAPQKPMRKSLSNRSSQGSESSQGDSPTPTPPSPTSQKQPESPSAYRSPASAASFVFARGSKKFVFEPHASQDVDSSLKKETAAELKSQGGPRSPDGKPPIQRKPSKIPPPVARKPSVGIPRTPTSPSSATAGINASVFTPQNTVSAVSLSGTGANGTLENHEQQQQKSSLEQA
ncbi:NHS-like protein 3 isoform X2 [Hyperolius riggenbachi]|uniref:NHS-like protein 3 isoform X2 n=1 Tax=Hyperolius riggenbachi TaxID=752182 RepID=UPI0035A301CE